MAVLNFNSKENQFCMTLNNTYQIDERKQTEETSGNQVNKSNFIHER